MDVLLNYNIEDIKDLESYLEKVDKDFGIPLSTKISAGDYSRKLLKDGHVIGIKNNGSILGIIGFYANDFVDYNAYISILSIEKNSRGHGYSKVIIRHFIEFCKEKKMKTLYVDSINPLAISLYKSLGFKEYKKEQCNNIEKIYLLKHI